MAGLIRKNTASKRSGGGSNRQFLGSILVQVDKIDIPNNKIYGTTISAGDLPQGKPVEVEIKQTTTKWDYKAKKEVPLSSDSLAKVNTVADMKSYVNGGVVRIDRCAVNGDKNAETVSITAEWGPNTVASAKEIKDGKREIFKGLTSFEPYFSNKTAAEREENYKKAIAEGKTNMRYLGKRWHPTSIRVSTVFPEDSVKVTSEADIRKVIENLKEDLAKNHNGVPFHVVLRAFRVPDVENLTDEQKLKVASEAHEYEKRETQIKDPRTGEDRTVSMRYDAAGSRFARTFSEMFSLGDDGFGGQGYISDTIDKQVAQIMTYGGAELLKLVNGENPDHKGEKWVLEVIPGQHRVLTTSYDNPKSPYYDIRSMATHVEAVDPEDYRGVNEALEIKNVYAGFGETVEEIVVAKNTPAPFSTDYVGSTVIGLNETKNGDASNIALEVVRNPLLGFDALTAKIESGEYPDELNSIPSSAMDIATPVMNAESPVQFTLVTQSKLVEAGLTEKYNEAMKEKLAADRAKKREDKAAQTPAQEATPEADASTPDEATPDDEIDNDGPDATIPF